MKKSAFFTLLKFCALALLSVNSAARFTDMQITQTTKSKREKVTKQVLFLEKILDYDTFVFRLNAAVIAPCKLANVKFYNGAKCIKDKKELENFSKSYDKEIKKIFRPGRNYYVFTLKNLGDRWLCLTDKKLEEPKKKSKKAENNATKNAQTEQDSLGSQPTQTQPQTPPSMPMESQGNGPVNLKELGIEFGKDFGEK